MLCKAQIINGQRYCEGVTYQPLEFAAVPRPYRLGNDQLRRYNRVRSGQKTQGRINIAIEIVTIFLIVSVSAIVAIVELSSASEPIIVKLAALALAIILGGGLILLALLAALIVVARRWHREWDDNEDLVIFSNSHAALRAARRDGETRIGFLGTLKPWHGLPLLVEAFARVHAEHPTARLHIIGDGPGRADLETDLAARGLTPYAHISGSIAAADVPAALGQIDIATAPYPAQDNFYFSPLKIYEYHAAGLPVITSRVGHLAEVVHDGEDGLLVPPDDPQALADAILSLARNPAHRTHLGDAGRIRVAREHSWESVAAKILALAEDA